MDSVHEVYKHRHSREVLFFLRDTQKVFGKGDARVQALLGVTLRIFRGEFLALFGPSGCGKSTLLNLLAGLEEPSAGSIFWKGRNIIKFDDAERAFYHRMNVGMIFQSYNLIRSLSVLDNVILPSLAVDIRHHTRVYRAQQLLKRFGLAALLHRRPSELSGGQQQKVGIARSLINHPKVILADEPTGNLDSKAAHEILQILKGLHLKGTTIIMVTHNVEQLVYADRVLHMLDGKITYEEDRHVRREFEKLRKKRPHDDLSTLKARFLFERLKRLKKFSRDDFPKLTDVLKRLAGFELRYDDMVKHFQRSRRVSGFHLSKRKAIELTDELFFTLPALNKPSIGRLTPVNERSMKGVMAR